MSWVHHSVYETRPSLAASVFLPNCNSSYGSYAFATCSVDAQQLSKTIQIEPGSDISVRGSSGLHSDLARSPAKSNTSSPIDIGQDWAAALNTPLPSNGPSNTSRTSIEAVLSKVFNLKDGTCDGWKDSWMEGIPIQVLEAPVGVIIADGLARIGSKSNYSITRTWDDRDVYSRNGTYIDSFYMSESEKAELTSRWSNVTPTAFRYGYGYGYGWGLETSTSIIAATVLLFHYLLALVTIAALLIRRVVSTRWSTSGYILALAFEIHS
ncbi:hypothetical protein DL98DRAFT_659440 [Cadophora sp. DSE1049]|nr:hypothetical protein DL98DRAFT_659440 [Cadophora sp. DSE1049]